MAGSGRTVPKTETGSHKRNRVDIIIENIRCFHGANTVPLKPITLLVGENSTGKSTFLAVLAAMTEANGFPFSLGFNTPPYALGNYENIATRKSSNAKPAASFKFGFRTGVNEKGGERTVVATCKGHLGQVVLAEFTITAPKCKITVEIQRKDARFCVKYLDDKTNEPKELAFASKLPDHDSRSGSELMSMFIMAIMAGFADKSNERSELLMSKVGPLVHTGGSFPFNNVISVAPIRTKPRRTYDQFNEEFKPEGDHVPLMLARLLESEEADDQAYRAAVKRALERFGQDSGLFDTVEIERLGSEPSSPFRVAVHLGGLALNLIDVGYGVSQSLPIIVQSLISKKGGMLLMQQPEVHLHPKAQAALGTFFVSLAKTQRLQFVIETHSDYLVDRVRQEVAKGSIRDEDVTILFFEKKNGKSTIHPISLDKEGNVTNAPEGYRSFFLEEEMNLLSRGQE